jgi:hypothetical protein
MIVSPHSYIILTVNHILHILLLHLHWVLEKWKNHYFSLHLGCKMKKMKIHVPIFSFFVQPFSRSLFNSFETQFKTKWFLAFQISQTTTCHTATRPLNPFRRPFEEQNISSITKDLYEPSTHSQTSRKFYTTKLAQTDKFQINVPQGAVTTRIQLEA